MAGDELNISILDINKHRSKLKDLCFKNRHKTIDLTKYETIYILYFHLLFYHSIKCAGD